MGRTGREGGGGLFQRRSPEERVVALAGNPNVGKSTLFNLLTNLRQHTGNWPGKTVSAAWGRYTRRGKEYILVDLPGAYSLAARSAEEEAARDFLCFGGADGAVVVCDATCLARNMDLLLQVLELQPRTVVCVNLMDEARRKGIQVDTAALSTALGVPVVGTSAGRSEGVERLMEQVASVLDAPDPPAPFRPAYPPPIEAAVEALAGALEEALRGRLPARWTALRLLEGDEGLTASMEAYLGEPLSKERAVAEAREALAREGIGTEALQEAVAATLVWSGAEIADRAVTVEESAAAGRDRRLDRLFTSRRTGIPILLLLLCLILWITIVGANLPSAVLSGLFSRLGEGLSALLTGLGAPEWLHGILMEGAYRVLSWVVAVMLPPMAIFFPLFTLLEDFGYLPRVAFLLDHPLQKAGACGKQALTMAMGFGCNAAGVVGCRIIDSPRERLLAVLTNQFSPCNGRFPLLIALLSMFLAGDGGPGSALLAAAGLTGLILLGAGAALGTSRLLSSTLLKGVPSSFALELPPYRPPRVGQVLARSFLDRTLFVLGRAVTVAAPAGAVIWLFGNVQMEGASLLSRCAALLDPFARALGLDGAILMAFLLGLPANEIVLPILLMGYLSSGTLAEAGSLAELREVLTANGWTWLTAACTALFSLMHWPCATTCLTIGRETGSLKWTLLAIAIPTAAGMAACGALAAAARALGLA